MRPPCLGPEKDGSHAPPEAKVAPAIVKRDRRTGNTLVRQVAEAFPAPRSAPAAGLAIVLALVVLYRASAGRVFLAFRVVVLSVLDVGGRGSDEP
jgi:hypothetical protein